MADQKGLDFLRAILGGQDQNTGLPLFNSNEVPVSNVEPVKQSPQGMPSAEDLNQFLKTKIQNKATPAVAAEPQIPTMPMAQDGNSPMTPEDLQNLQAAKIAEVAPAAAKQASISSIKQSLQDTQSPEQKLVAEQLANSQNPLVDNDMKNALAQAQEQADTNQRRKGLFEMMAGIGSLGGSKMSAESESLDNAIKMQNAPVDQVNQERDAYKKFLANNEEMEKADPNSAVSKTMRQALSGMGVKIPDNASYSTMEKLAPQLMANQQFKDRMADRALQREQIAQNKDIANQSKMSDKQNSYLQFATTKTAPIRAAYSTIQNAAKLASSKTSNPAEDITTLYSFVKNLDPNSSVREGEVGLARDIASVQGKVSTYFNKLQNGDSLDSKTVDNLKKEILRLAKSQKESYDTEMSAYKTGAKNRGIPEDRFAEFDPYGKSDLSETKMSDTVRIQSASGQVGMIPRANLQEALKRGAKEI